MDELNTPYIPSPHDVFYSFFPTRSDDITNTRTELPLTRSTQIMDGDSESQNELKGSPSKTKHLIKDFCNYTTTHGVGRLAEAKTIFSRFIWSIFILGSLSMFIYQTSGLFGLYLSRPISTVVKVKHKTEVTFPAVTVCNQNPVKLHKIPENYFQDIFKEVNERLEEEHNGLADDEIETTQSPTAETPGNDTELDIDPDDELRADYLIEELLIAKLAVENNTMLSEMGHQFKDLVFDCNFRGNDCRNFSKYWYHFWDFRYGNCYIFNSGINQTILETQTTGPFGGLKLNLFIESHEYVSQLSHAEGARIVIHDQAAIPFPDDEGMNVLPGISTSVGIRTEKIQRADPFNNGSCRKISEVEKGLNRPYSREACMKSCLSTLQIRKCGCADAHSAYDETIGPICDILKNRKIETCLNDLVERFMNGELDCQSECPVLCSEVVFKPTTSMARWPSQGYKQRLFNLLKKRGNDAYADQLSDGADFLEEDFLQVRVFFERLNFQEVREELSYKDVNLLADIGGQLGLWIGVSVLTCCEFLELALRLTQNLFKRLAAQRNKFKVGGLQK